MDELSPNRPDLRTPARAKTLFRREEGCDSAFDPTDDLVSCTPVRERMRV